MSSANKQPPKDGHVISFRVHHAGNVTYILKLIQLGMEAEKRKVSEGNLDAFLARRRTIKRIIQGIYNERDDLLCREAVINAWEESNAG